MPTVICEHCSDAFHVKPSRSARGNVRHCSLTCSRAASRPAPPNPSGMCQCGCGEPAPLAPQSHRHFGYVKDQPMRFIRGHNQTGQRVKTERWREEDRGYETPCWIWQLGLNRPEADYGYGKCKVRGRQMLAHRVVYEEYRGPIPAGLVLDHLCCNTSCVNPEHLEPVTSRENIRRGGVRKPRQAA